MENNYTLQDNPIGDRHILAVEDSMVQAKMLQHFFDVNGIKSKIFSNARDAYESAKADIPVLIISDIIMPEMDGYEFCSLVKNNPELKHLPVILLTSLRDPLDIVKGLQAGADNFITKPYEDTYLLSRIRYLLANSITNRNGTDNQGIEIAFQGTNYFINSDKKQILNLLLSVYEAAINQNKELIEAKQQLEALNHHLEAANEELDAFARTVSHDLQSPLSGIIGFIQLILDDWPGTKEDELLTNLQWVLKSAYKMSELISDLLNYSRSSRASIQRQPINLSELANDLVGDMKMKSADQKFLFIAEENLMVHADLPLIRIALTNLLSNAVKYSGKAENPEIRLGSTIIYGQKVFFIKDNGIGFDMMKAGNLFNPFIRLHTSKGFQGTGIGLSTVKRILNRHGGDIWFESEPGKGATFFFTIDEKE
jgi:two-component system sensor histidine kinase/response regulator